MADMEMEDAASHIELCVNLCEVAPPGASADELEALLGDVCADAGFPHCERVYVGSYFCENYFCALGDGFHAAVGELCRRHDMGATLVVPVFGQAFLGEGERRVDQALALPGVYDEAVANDVARFLDLNARYPQRLGIGRLFSKVMRDARIDRLAGGISAPELSAEAFECAEAVCEKAAGASAEPDAASSAPAAFRASDAGPVVELDPTSAMVDASRVVEAAPGGTVAIHLPYCYATTGRNCTLASVGKPRDEKFRIGRPCELQCLDVRQAWRTDEGVPFVKHGRTFFFENPACAIEGVSSWRVIHA